MITAGNDSSTLLPIGTLLQMGKYRIDSYLSSGGFGNTYIVTNMQFDEQYAMKEFFMKGVNERNDDSTMVSVSNKDNHQQFEQQREKFKKEARRLRKLNNPHIVHVHDLFDENGTTYYVMDFIDGQTVSSLIKQTRRPLPENDALDIVHQVLDALEVVHKEGIWHLDIKPGNIMLDKDGNVVVIDFGASKQLSTNDGYTSTSTALCYTPGYAPSEQIDQNMQKIGPWTDLYALGATLYNMVTLNQPPSVSEIIDGNAFRFPKSVSENIQQLIKWMMNPSRQKRPQSVNDVRLYIKPSVNTNNTILDETTMYSFKLPEREKTELPRKQKQEKKDISGPKANKTKMYVVLLVVASVISLLIYLLSLSGKSTDTFTDRENVVVPSQPQKNELNIQNSLINSLSKTNRKVSSLYEKLKYYSGENAVTQMEISSPLGSYLYTGPTDELGLPNGTGLAEFKDNRLYFGTFYHGNIQGDAFFRYENGDTFEGEFTKESKFLNGKYTIKEDGSYFVGTFKDGQPYKGQWYDKNGNKIN